MPEEVVQKIKDIVREFYDELGESGKQGQAGVVRPMPSVTSISKALAGVCIVRAAHSGELTVEINPAKIAKWDLPTITNWLKLPKQFST